MSTNFSTTTTNKVQDMVLIAMFAVLIAICSWISIPTVVPFTLQTFAVFLTVSVLGGKRGTIAIAVYLMLGAIGLPVYSGGRAGIGILFGNTGGYLIGWIFSGFVMWGMENILGRKTWALALSMLMGLIVCYALGTIWFMLIYAKTTGQIGVWTAITWCVFPFVIPDLVKIGVALVINKRLAKTIHIL